MTEEPIPLVSIVSGFYNREKSVYNSIQSLLEQTYTNFELIIFDDCSTDNTLKELKSIKDDRIRIIEHKENIGFTRGMINAISTAKGEYIAVHGSGDISHPKRIAKQVDILKSQSGCSLVGCLSRSLNFRDLEVISQRGFKKNIYEKTDLIHQVPFTHGSALYRRKDYIEVGGYNKYFKYCQDRNLWMKLGSCGYCYVIGEYLYDQVVDLNSVSTAYSKMRVQTFYVSLAIKIGQNLIDEKELNQDLIAELMEKHKIPFADIYARYLRMYSIDHIELHSLLNSRNSLLIIHRMRVLTKRLNLSLVFFDRVVSKIVKIFSK